MIIVRMVVGSDHGTCWNERFTGFSGHTRSMPEVVTELYKVIEARGPDTVSFLQGQLTQDLRRLNTETRLFAAWCNPKGRVIVTIRLAAIDDDVALVVPVNMVEYILEKMSLYRFRAKVEFIVTDRVARNFIESDYDDHDKLIQAGIPYIDVTNTESFTPHMLNLDKLDAISFTKGCYTGQEIVARTEHRGRTKRRLMLYESDSSDIAAGANVTNDDQVVGQVVNVSGHSLLAVTLVESHATRLKVNETSISPTGLPYSI